MATEKRLIDRDALLEQLEREWATITDIDDYYYIIKDMPTVDAVEVVRCKDCKHWMYEYDDVGLCVTDVPDVEGVQRHACDYCSYGERNGNGKNQN